MALHSQRKRRAERDALEADGSSLWTEQLDPKVRAKISGMWQTIKSATGKSSYEFDARVGSILKIHGGYNVTGVGPDVLQRSLSDDFVLDIVGALHMYLASESYMERFADQVQNFTNEVFEDHRVAFRMIEGEIIPFESDELHREVIEPAIRLMVDSRFVKAQIAYVKALKEISVDPADSITDAGTALQEALEALGCQGQALGALISDAKSKGILGSHDNALTSGIEKFLVWAAAIRNNTGDGHHVTTPTRSDAWLMVHIVGALIVRLADPIPRGQTR